jgi:Fic family protein
MANYLREQANKLDLQEDPAIIIAHVRKASQSGGPEASDELWEKLERSLINVVYGSNLIETAGSSIRITLKLCQAVFRGEPVSPDINELDPTYKEHLENLSENDRKASKENVVQSRREVIQHARALVFMIDSIVLYSKPWSESLILKTHAILHDGLSVDTDEDVPGHYRQHEVAVSYSKPGEKRQRSQCIRAVVVPNYMKDFITNLNNDISTAEASGEIDPYTLAAKYHHQFVMIHPFGDGNGRISRIILNVLLLKYAGHVAPVGTDKKDKETYLAIVRRGSKTFREEDMEVEFSEHTGHHETAKYVLSKSKGSLNSMWTWATQRARRLSPGKGRKE